MSADCTERRPALGWGWRDPDPPPHSVTGESGVSPDDDQWDSEEAADWVSDLQSEALLKEMQQSSMQIIAELDELETQLEVERACRESAEELAVKLSKENRKLQRMSLVLQPVWENLPEDIAQLAPGTEESADPSEDPVYQYQLQIKDLQERITQLLEEKKQLTGKVTELELRVAELLEKAEKEQREKKLLKDTLNKQNKNLQRLSTVSNLVTQEYQELQQNLELEQNLRQRAESYAHQMRVKKQEANRQSLILLEKAEPSIQLLKALEEASAAHRTLEEERFLHEKQVKDLQAQLEGSEHRKEVERLGLLLQLADEHQTELENQVQEAERRNQELETKLRDLQQERSSSDGPMCEVDEGAASITPPSPPPPPPPPPPLPPPSAAPIDPLAELLRRRQKDGQKKVDGPSSLSDIKGRAVNEMMERIKSGVVLKPTKRKTELTDAKPSDTESKGSAVMELQGILNSMGKKKVRQKSWRNDKRQNELDTILQRRRKMTEKAAGPKEKKTEDPGSAIPQEAQGEPQPVGQDRVSNIINPGEGIRRVGCIRQSRRTSAVIAFNRRVSQEMRRPASEPNLQTEGGGSSAQEG